MERKDSFVFYRSFYESLNCLNNEDKIQIMNAICEYALNQNEVELQGSALAIFTLIKPLLTANNARYENGKRGGRPIKNKKPNPNLDVTKTKPNPNLTLTKTEPPRNLAPSNDVDVDVNVDVNDNVNAKTPTNIDNTNIKYVGEKLQDIGVVVNKIIFEYIESWLKLFKVEIIEEAIKIATANGKNKVAYIDGIILNWKINGFNNLKSQYKNKDVPKWFDNYQKEWQERLNKSEITNTVDLEALTKAIKGEVQ